MVVVGTRPEAIKLAPLVIRLREVEGLTVRLISTGQHRELLSQALREFGLTADVDLKLMRPDQNLAELTARALVALDHVIVAASPALILAQGDTTTVLATALAAYYQRVPFGHVEAGLRTGQPGRPFPEEKNRVLASHLAAIHFAPTRQAVANLLRESIEPSSIFCTGNTGIDALRWVLDRLPLPPESARSSPRTILLTAHRRENLGDPLAGVCQAVLDLVQKYPDLVVRFPVHPNPSVQTKVVEWLGRTDRVELVAPAGYRDFVGLMRSSYLILTDSGGVQEEGPTLGVPVLVLRDETERPEAVAAGTVRLVGTDPGAIVRAVDQLWNDPIAYEKAATRMNPYGDGFAVERIVRLISMRLGVQPPPPPSGFVLEWP